MTWILMTMQVYAWSCYGSIPCIPSEQSNWDAATSYSTKELCVEAGKQWGILHDQDGKIYDWPASLSGKHFKCIPGPR